MKAFLSDLSIKKSTDRSRRAVTVHFVLVARVRFPTLI